MIDYRQVGSVDLRKLYEETITMERRLINNYFAVPLDLMQPIMEKRWAIVSEARSRGVPIYPHEIWERKRDDWLQAIVENHDDVDQVKIEADRTAGDMLAAQPVLIKIAQLLYDEPGLAAHVTCAAATVESFVGPRHQNTVALRKLAAALRGE